MTGHRTVRQRRGVGFAGAQEWVLERDVLLQEPQAQPTAPEHRSLRWFETTGKNGEKGGLADAVGPRDEQSLRGGDVQVVQSETARDPHAF